MKNLSEGGFELSTKDLNLMESLRVGKNTVHFKSKNGTKLCSYSLGQLKRRHFRSICNAKTKEPVAYIRISSKGCSMRYSWRDRLEPQFELKSPKELMTEILANL